MSETPKVSIKHSMHLIGRYKCIIIGILKLKGNFEHGHERSPVIGWGKHSRPKNNSKIELHSACVF